jgi:hypothetical protein
MKINAVQCLAVILALAGAACVPVRAQADLMFPFVLPWDDATAGTATDVSFLNAKPAGVHGFVVAKNGHFYESRTNTRVRFLGTNFAARSAFPSHADAEKVAARVAKLGINIVRLHHMDNDGWGPGANIWDPAYKDHQHIDAAQLDRLDYLISQLKKNGVYVNINLHVSRQFTPDDGFSASVNDIKMGFDKRVDEFDRRMILLQKNYAHDLLTHVNPYTGLSYAADPCVAVIEINNENSLVGDPWATLGADLDTVPEPFRGELVGQWNVWLTKKYGTDARLQTAWLQDVTPPGEPINSKATWSLEHQGTSDASMTPDAAQDAAISVATVDGTDWHVQAHQTGLDFQAGKTYTVSFRSKSDKPRPLNVNAGLDQADWHNIGLNATADLGTDWKTFHFAFEAHDVVSDHGRVAFVLGNQTGTVWISDLQVKPGAEGVGLQSGQSLITKSVAIPDSATRNQHADWIAFLADTERAYADEMRAYLKDTLHVHANIICSQISWGGLTGLNREANMDFADNHAYWQHPSFPHKAWDPNDWTIGNTSMVADLANGGGGTLRDLAEYRVARKPYSISEYNEPAPNDFQAEAVPVLASFAAFQDWDMLYLFDYGDYGAGAANDKINGYFGIGSNPAKTAFLPAAAMIFRHREIDPGTSSVVVTPEKYRVDSTAVPVWKAITHLDGIASVRYAINGPGEKSVGKLFASKPEMTFLKTNTGGEYREISPSADVLVGDIGGQTVGLEGTSLTFPNFGDNFAAVTLTQMPNKSRLLTMIGKVENQGMVWNAERTSIGDQWGHGPTMAEGIPATVTLKSDGPRHVYALDGTGKRVTDVPVTFEGGNLKFTVGPQYKTLWYEIAP